MSTLISKLAPSKIGKELQQKQRKGLDLYESLKHLKKTEKWVLNE